MEHDNNCPLTKESLGYHTWMFLHTMVANYPDEPSTEQRQDINDFFILFSRLYPCQICANGFSQLIIQRPPETNSQETLNDWLCWIHNQINKKIGKPIFDCQRVNERWRDGWKDGSCD